MKEITRRLYTKPVMLGIALVVGMFLVVGLFVTAKSTAAPPNSFPVAAGNDEFETAGDGETFHDFGGSPIPANFFGSGSQAYSGLVILQGVPLAPGSDVDTVIQRHSAVQGPGGSTALTMTGLSLRGTAPIKVTYTGGAIEYWDMTVGLSAYKASTGSMTINSSTFDSSLKVWPKFTFTKVGGGGTKVLDTGAPGGGPGFTANAAAPVEGIGTEPAPMPIATIAPCQVVISPTEKTTKLATADSAFATAAASNCAPVTLSSLNSPWGNCAGGGFCIFVPITEEERWARHRPGPRGTIKGGAIAE
ncbi:MAG TPA: hypothetical protein VFI24_20735 [Pyrinomonadaceae bacterium]|nr:hypothetical protein [Pyrinomonadaceae bacterium]